VRERDGAASMNDRRLWQPALAGGLLLCAAYAVIPSSYVVLRELVVYLLAEVGAIVAILVGVRRYRPAAAAAWLLIAVGLSFWTVGDTLWGVYTVLDRDPFPSVADLFYLTGYPFLAAGLALAARRSRARDDDHPVLDAAIVAVGLSLIGWTLLVETFQANRDLDLLGSVISLAYPVGDVLLLGVAIPFLLRDVWRVPAFRLLGTALVLTLVGDAIFALDVLDRVAGSERLANTTLLVGMVLFGASALHPSMRLVTEPAAGRPLFGTWRLIVIAAACLAPTTVVVIQAARGELPYIPVSIGVVLAQTGLVVARFASLAADARRAANRESILSQYAADLLRSSGREQLFSVAGRAAGELLGGGRARLVDPGGGGHAFAAPVTVQGRVIAELVADAERQALRPVQNSLRTVAAELSLALDRERLLIIEREAAEALNEQNERLRELDRMKDQFVSTVSHELRTPLTSMVGYLELVLEGEAGSLSDDQQRFLEIVDRNCDRLNTLIDDILFVARIDAGRFSLEKQRVDLVELSAAAVESAKIAAERAGVDLRFSAPDEVSLSADSTRLTQLLDNLLSNAIKFSPDGGTVSVTLAADENAVRLRVQDAGVGIPEEEVGRLFERFFRASTGSAIRGTGLGLSIVKSIAEAHEGTVTVESEVGVGTTFTVELPLSVRSPANHQAEEVAT
jgi:signal transduction histidine kinase